MLLILSIFLLFLFFSFFLYFTYSIRILDSLQMMSSAVPRIEVSSGGNKSLIWKNVLFQKTLLQVYKRENDLMQ